MRVSEHFFLERTQPTLDFVDVRVDTDTAIFVDPSSIRGLETTWGAECQSLLQHFFQHVLHLIKSGANDEAVLLLTSLRERNEFHLGFSVGASKGRGFGSSHAKDVWRALTRSRAAKSGLLQDLEDTCLLIEGIGPDMVSDAICNVIRGPLIRYTQDMCRFYDIPMEPAVASGPMWDAQGCNWIDELVELPVVNDEKLLLVPKAITRLKFSFSSEYYYRHYLLPELQREELAKNSGLVKLLKDGRPKVTKKSLVDKYGAGKLVAVDLTIPRAHVLDRYRSAVRRNARKPISHEGIAEAVQVALPDWDELLRRVVTVSPGNAGSAEYENAIEALLTALFYPALLHPTKQHEIHQGRKRIDITYVNAAATGFFHWIGLHYPSSMIFVECKNYGREVGNPELDQISGRFSPNRGKVGFMFCRTLENQQLMEQRCYDTANDQRGFVMVLDDQRLSDLVAERRARPNAVEFAVLRRMFSRLVS